MKFSVRQVFVAVTALAVAAAVIYGVILAGSPRLERSRQFDNQRVNHLQQISFGIESYYSRNKELPPTLSALSTSREIYIESVTDPEIEVFYEYRPTGKTTYELCANFDLPSEISQPGISKPFDSLTSKIWQHPAGRYCYALDSKTGVVSQKKSDGCVLMKETKTGKVDCYGCAGTVCKDPAPGWEKYDAPSQPGYIGIPYSCGAAASGCELAQ
ncbi:hypothetical protein EPN90_01675 [Patescibacteria group bacterium]|nr:MAG: hypothetical protein EPN90_01675 [Patescibacteria group bacterium]